MSNRKNIYFQDETLKLLDKLTEKTGLSNSELIKTALERFDPVESAIFDCVDSLERLRNLYPDNYNDCINDIVRQVKND